MDVAKEGKQVDRVVLANGSRPDDWKQDMHFIESAEIAKDALNVSVSYTGGCVDHDFRLVAWDYFSKAEIPQVKLLLAHDANGDPCKALIREALCFDISPLKAEYHRACGTKPGTLLLRLRDLNMEYCV